MIGSIILYLPTIWLLQCYMANRPAFKLKRTAVLRNLFLAVISALGVALMLMDGVSMFGQQFYPESMYPINTRAVIAIFSLTKNLEFGDTILLVLKKKPLLFLHIYHHITVALYCWHAQYVNINFAHHFCFINLAIHTVMYSYYAVALVYSRHPLLRRLRPYITMSQTLQMFVGMYISYTAITRLQTQNEDVDVLDTYISNAWYALAMYTSYAYLFAKLYLENYVKGVRPIMTLCVMTIHIVAAVGAFMVYKHKERLKILTEILLMYSFSALLLWFTSGGNRAVRHAVQSLRNTSKPVEVVGPELISQSITQESKLDRTVPGKPLTLDSGVERTKGVVLCVNAGHVALLFLNCWIAWAREYYSRLETKETKVSSPKSSTALIMSLVEKPLDAKKTDSISTVSSENEITPVSLYEPFLSPFKGAGKERMVSSLLSIMCCSLPAIYGLHAYGDFFMGVCVHGCLRWLLELYTTSQFWPGLLVVGRDT